MPTFIIYKGFSQLCDPNYCKQKYTNFISSGGVSPGKTGRHNPAATSEVVDGEKCSEIIVTCVLIKVSSNYRTLQSRIHEVIHEKNHFIETKLIKTVPLLAVHGFVFPPHCINREFQHRLRKLTFLVFQYALTLQKNIKTLQAMEIASKHQPNSVSQQRNKFLYRKSYFHLPMVDLIRFQPLVQLLLILNENEKYKL